MLIDTLQQLYQKDLSTLKQEIQLYQNESNIWITDKDIKNSGGNLCLHIVGNLKTFIGAEIGKTDYIRNRQEEFSLKNVPQHVLLESVDETIKIVHDALEQLRNTDLSQEFPVKIWKDKTSYDFLLIKLLTHLRYHTGQINYHRRLLDV